MTKPRYVVVDLSKLKPIPESTATAIAVATWQSAGTISASNANGTPPASALAIAIATSNTSPPAMPYSTIKALRRPRKTNPATH